MSADCVKARVLAKARFWYDLEGQSLNHQRAMLNTMIDAFEGKVASSKWAVITHAQPHHEVGHDPP